ncbi:MAG: CAP domain-containing protein [Deltaproteobacteria bacterium]|nr:CAP domain-containing protein [Deltaproteobacteria bacterium]
MRNPAFILRSASAIALLASALAFSLASGGDDEDPQLSPLVDAGTSSDPADAGTASDSADAGVSDAARPEPVCGDGVCDTDSECGSCPYDCGPCTERELLEDRLLGLINEMRLSGGNCPSGYQPPVKELTFHLALRTAARGHVEDMAEQDYFAHESLDGRTPWDRMLEAGYDGSPRGEDLAAGYPDAESTFRQWLDSDGHCLVMMTPHANEGAIGYAYQALATYRHYWALDVGWR